MVSILKGHGPFTTPSITITPHPNPFSKQHRIAHNLTNFLSIQMLTHLILKDTLGGNSPKHQNMQYLTHAINSNLLYINEFK